RAAVAGLARGARGRDAAEAAVLEGQLELRLGRPAAARALFARALGSLEASDGLALQARFWALVAGVCADDRAPARPGPELRLCGLGLFPPYTATLETLREIRGCDVLVNNLSEIETWDVLRLLRPDLRCVTYIDGGNDA